MEKEKEKILDLEFQNFLKKDKFLNEKTAKNYFDTIKKLIKCLQTDTNKYTGKNENILNILNKQNQLKYDNLTKIITNFSESIYKEHPYLKEKSIYELTNQEIDSIRNNNSDFYNFFKDTNYNNAINACFNKLKLFNNDKNYKNTFSTTINTSQKNENLFLSKNKVQEILKALEYKKNIILQGPPGVGKTFIIDEIIKLFLKEKTSINIAKIQFHQSYSYEDFIEGYKPNKDKGFELKNGIFKNFCNKAIKDPKNKYFFIIDEINRGNLSKIFGELLSLIEKDKRDKYKMLLNYSGDEFFVPGNLYIISTMNTADRSLALVDYALRRRFAFIDLIPNFEEENFKKFMINKNMILQDLNVLINKITELNNEIKNDPNLGDGYLIGHSYFCDYDGSNFRDWFNLIIDLEIIPLIKEYWFDDLDKTKELTDKLKG